MRRPATTSATRMLPLAVYNPSSSCVPMLPALASRLSPAVCRHSSSLSLSLSRSPVGSAAARLLPPPVQLPRPTRTRPLILPSAAARTHSTPGGVVTRAFSVSTPLLGPIGPIALQGSLNPSSSSGRRSSCPTNVNKIRSPPTSRSQQISGHFSASPSFSTSHSPSSSSSSPHNIMASPKYTARKVGAPHTLEHRIYIEKDGQLVSPFHDIPLYANEQQTILNMVVEIPRWTNAKQEISKDEALNPIKQDTKKGKLRFVRNCFPHKGYLWNYGAFPQTWEDPNATHPETKQKGDNDPLDVCEIGELVAKPGDVKQVKVLGVMALLDEGETDWKIIVIDVNDPLAPKLNDIEDVERHLPGLLRATNEWFRIYKIPDGKPENQFAFSGECKNRKYAMEVVRECAEAWEKLITGKTPKGDINLTNTTVSHSQDRTEASKLSIPKHEDKSPAPIDPSIDKWFYISGASA